MNPRERQRSTHGNAPVRAAATWLRRALMAVSLLALLAACQPSVRPTPPAVDAAPAPVTPPPAAPPTPEPPPAAPEPASLARLRARLQPLECSDDAATVRWLKRYAAPRARLGERLGSVLPLLDFVERELAARELPAEFALMPFIESDYRADAVGRGGPLGMWQLMAATARAHGASIDPQRDARLSVLESTFAALDHLQKLMRRFGDWRLAAMAFNAGEARVAKATAKRAASAPIERWLPPGLPAITIQYVAKLQALSCLIAQPSSYRLSLPEQAPDRILVSVALPPTAHSVAAIAVALGVDDATLRRLNGFKRAQTYVNGARRVLVPQPAQTALDALAQLHESPPPHMDVQVPRAQDAQERPPHMDVQVPRAQDAQERPPHMDVQVSRAQDAQERPPIASHTVRSGESLWTIARRYELRIVDLQRINGLDPKAVLRIGQVLRLAR
jgi:membrane-bound lytic murein transglycosylase D